MFVDRIQTFYTENARKKFFSRQESHVLSTLYDLVCKASNWLSLVHTTTYSWNLSISLEIYSRGDGTERSGLPAVCVFRVTHLN